MIEQLTLETERLRLCPAALDHAAALQALVSDERIAATTLNIPYPYPENGAVEWIEMVLERRAAGAKEQTFAIIRKADDEVMGAIGIHVGPDDFSAEIGYWIGVPYWGQGYMSEAAGQVIRYGFEHLDLQRVFATYFTTNPASGRVMQKNGMTFEGIMRQHILKWGEFIDVGYYSILRSEFEAQRK